VRWFRWAVAVYDRGYRLLHGLDRPEAQAGPLLRVERRHLWRARRLANGTVLRRGAPVGVLHLNPARALALHAHGLSPRAIGFEGRRLFLASLRVIAARAADGGPLAPLEAYSATTLFHRRLPTLGFCPAVGARPICRRVVTGYERALLGALHPAGAARLRGMARGEARQLWLSRAQLLSRYGSGAPAHTRGGA
jgi:hypothetical protein